MGDAPPGGASGRDVGSGGDNAGRGDRQLGDPVPAVVDVDDAAPAAVEQTRGDPGPVAGAAVDPQLAGGERAGAGLDLVDGDVDGPGEVSVVVLVALADVDDDERPGGCSEVGPAGAPVARGQRCGRRQPVDAGSVDP